jgi:hypothetical protein
VIVTIKEEASAAVDKIATLLGPYITKSEAIERAIITELYLLEEIRYNNAKVFIEVGGKHTEIFLIDQGKSA